MSRYRKSKQNLFVPLISIYFTINSTIPNHFLYSKSFELVTGGTQALAVVAMAVLGQSLLNVKLINSSSNPNPDPSLRLNFSAHSRTLITMLLPVFTSVKSFAPVTIANLGPGFDFLGCTVDGIGDLVTHRLDPDVRPGELSISDISGAGKKLRRNPLWNCAGIAVMNSIGSLFLEKGLPLGSGLGSNKENEGIHHVWKCSQAGALVASVLQGDASVFGKALSSDRIVGAKESTTGSWNGASEEGGNGSRGFLELGPQQ